MALDKLKTMANIKGTFELHAYEGAVLEQLQCKSMYEYLRRMSESYPRQLHILVPQSYPSHGQQSHFTNHMIQHIRQDFCEDSAPLSVHSRSYSTVYRSMAIARVDPRAHNRREIDEEDKEPRGSDLASYHLSLAIEPQVASNQKRSSSGKEVATKWWIFFPQCKLTSVKLLNHVYFVPDLCNSLVAQYLIADAHSYVECCPHEMLLMTDQINDQSAACCSTTSSAIRLSNPYMRGTAGAWKFGADRFQRARSI